MFTWQFPPRRREFGARRKSELLAGRENARDVRGAPTWDAPGVGASTEPTLPVAGQGR